MKSELSLVPHRNKGALAALVFIHGFSGNAARTWGDFPKFLLAREDLFGWDVYSFGYATSLLPDILGIWRADASIPTLADLLRTTCSCPPMDKYKAIAFLAHSMGGLILQRALLDDHLSDRTNCVLFFGTPSGGLGKASHFSFWKRQLRDMGSKSEFILDLRTRWALQFQHGVPFTYWAVAGDQDDFVPRTSSLDPFPLQQRAVVPGDHLRIVKPVNIDHPSVGLVLKTLRGDRGPADGRNSARLAVEMRQFRQAVRLLEPLESELDQQGLVELALALEGVGRQQDAIRVLERSGKKGTDAMGVLAGRLKRRWYVERRQADIKRAYQLYNEAFKASVKKRDNQQAFYHGINVAFLDVAYRKNLHAARLKARRVLEYCSRTSRKDKWCYATIGEANLILGDITRAVSSYEHALTLDITPRERDSIQQQALRLADVLGSEDLMGKVTGIFMEK